MLARIRNRRNRLWAMALAVVVNLGGGPMAWAHLSGAGNCHESSAAVTQMPADCPEHQIAKRDHSPSHTMPCCDGGSCVCAAPPAPPVFAFLAPADLRHESLPAVAIDLVAPNPLDDSLRPPIR